MASTADQGLLNYLSNDIGSQESDVLYNRGLLQQRLLRNYLQYDLPDLVDSEATKGTYYSGGANRRSARLGTAANEAYGDIGYQSSQMLADLARKRSLAGFGVLF